VTAFINLNTIAEAYDERRIRRCVSFLALTLVGIGGIGLASLARPTGAAPGVELWAER